MGGRSGIDVFEYLDHRSFLRDFYVLQKRLGRGFSYRRFSERAGLRSPNYLKLVIDAERNLSAPMAERFARACGLDGEDAEYFQDLVVFNQAKSATDRAVRYGRLAGYRRFRAAQPLELARGEYHSKWYLPAIRELVARSDFDESPRWIAARIRPELTSAQAKKGLATLLELGLLARDGAGRIVRSEPSIPATEATGVHVDGQNRAMMEQAWRSLDRFGERERDISSLTLCLNADGLERVRQCTARFRRELLDLAALEDDPEQVIQINVQVFPLSSTRDPTRSA